jgi:hypothetical protein
MNVGEQSLDADQVDQRTEALLGGNIPHPIPEERGEKSTPKKIQLAMESSEVKVASKPQSFPTLVEDRSTNEGHLHTEVAEAAEGQEGTVLRNQSTDVRTTLEESIDVNNVLSEAAVVHDVNESQNALKSSEESDDDTDDDPAHAKG